MKKNFSIIGSILFLIIGLTIAIFRLLMPELDQTGNMVVSILIITIGLWIFKPFGVTFGMSSVFFMAMLLISGVPAPIVLSGFSGATVWTLIPALYYGFVLSKTGLGKRLAYFCLKLLPISYFSLLLMWIVAGVILSLLTPSITVRVVIVTPIALSCADICKLPKKSKERSLVLITAWAMMIIPGIGWLTGSLNGPMISGLYASIPGLVAVDFNSWLKVSLLPVAIITILTVLGGYLASRPSSRLNIPKKVFQDEYLKLGKVSRREAISAIVLVASFSMFATRSYHGIPDAAVCLMGFFILCITGIINGSDVSPGISWDLVLFIGCTMGFGTILSATGISNLLSDLIVKAIAPFTINPWVFVFTVLIVFFLLRFLDIAMFIPTIAIVSSIAPSVTAQYGINPLIWIPLLCICSNAFFFSYQNMFALVGESNMKEFGWTSADLFRYGTAYFVASLLTMLVAIPYWGSLNLF